MTRRKTFSVAEFTDKINRFLASDPSQISEVERRTAIVILNDILHETGNYQGYQYLEWMNGGCNQWIKDGSPDDKAKYIGDETRRHYFLNG